ncbi:hypothetical protein I6F35_09805 [Bradyrhizobium sp. BRP22]|nr:hypothetical protein [Bradyrhizobium sp. BRP22]
MQPRMTHRWSRWSDVLGRDQRLLGGQGCREFGQRLGARSVPGCEVLSHPERGRLAFEYASFQANDDPALKLIIYAAA